MNGIASMAKAYALATVWHAKQRRKGEAGEPYVGHLAEVAHLVAEAADDINLTIAAVLHDAIEDAGMTAERIEAEFGLKLRGWSTK